MERDVLQVFASTYVAESDIPTEDKLMLIDYIRECDEFGVMYLLSTGEMLGENEYLDEKACGILFEQYQASLAPLLEAKPKGYYKMKGAHIKTVAGRKVAAAKGAAGRAGAAAKGAAGRAGAATIAAAGRAGRGVKGAAISAGSKVKAGVQGAAFDAQMKLRGAKKAAAHQVKGVTASMRQAGAGAKQAGSGAKEAGKGLGGALKSASKIPGAKPAVAAAAAAAYGYAVYKRFFSAASKACAGKSGADRSACVDRFKKQAKMAQVKELQKGMAKCGNDPRCRSKLQGKISKAKSNM